MKYTTLTKMADSVMYEASDEQLDHPAVAGGVSVWGGSKISNPRPGCKIRDGGPGSHSIPEDKRCADLVSKVPGRMVSPSAGWAAAAASCSTM